jgi:transcriptional regulator with XRE-family HTH domain
MLLRDAIGEVLRETRLEQGRTLFEVAGSSNVSLPYLSEVERGRKEASSEVIESVASALGIPTSTVLIAAAARLDSTSNVVALPTTSAQAPTLLAA